MMDRSISKSNRGTLLGLLCHGDPDRCYRVRGKALPLCARCIAFYPLFLISAILSIPLFLILSFEALTMTIAFVLLVCPLVVDGCTQYFGLRTSNNLLRTITGALAGLGCGLSLSYLSVRLLQGLIDL